MGKLQETLSLSEHIHLAIVEMAQKGDPQKLISPEERQRVAAMVLSALKKMGRQDLLPYIWIYWNPRLTTAMGRALFARPGDSVAAKHKKFLIDGRAVKMELSIPLWPRATTAQKNQTILHELSHLITHQEALLMRQDRPKDHGRRWKRTMARIGADDARTHDVDVGGLGKRKAQVQCGCGTQHVTPRVAGEILMGKKYTCQKCKQFVTVPEISHDQELEYLAKASAHELKQKARREKKFELMRIAQRKGIKSW